VALCRYCRPAPVGAAYCTTGPVHRLRRFWSSSTVADWCTSTSLFCIADCQCNWIRPPASRDIITISRQHGRHECCMQCLDLPNICWGWLPAFSPTPFPPLSYPWLLFPSSYSSLRLIHSLSLFPFMPLSQNPPVWFGIWEGAVKCSKWGRGGTPIAKTFSAQKIASVGEWVSECVGFNVPPFECQ